MPHIAIKNYLHESQLFLGRAIVSAIIVIALLLALVLRLGYLQIVSHDHFTTLSQDNRVKLAPLAPTRGLIYDRNGVLLAQNVPAYSLEITPERVQDMQATLDGLGELIPISDDDRERFAELRKQGRRFDSIPIRVKLDEEEVARFAVNRHRFPAVDIQAKLLREYPLGPETAHVLGYVGRINEQELKEIDTSNYSGTSYIGKNGVEKYYEDLLHGKVGFQQVEVNASGRVLRVLEDQPPTPGSDLRLFLDNGLQEEAMQALGDYNGAVAAIDVKTGGVLALVSKPGFDPNLFVEGISTRTYTELRDSEDKPLFNRALRGQYPPGSAIKPFVGLAGLETQTIGLSDEKYCPGFYRLPGHSHRYRDWKKAGHGPMAMHDAIVQSCDVYFYDLARALGVDQLQEFLARFGFGSRTGVDLSGELGGLLPSREWKSRSRGEPWYPGETLIMGIGQGYFLVTPLQLASAVATLASQGKRLRPRVVASIQAPGENEAPKPTAADPQQLDVYSIDDWERITAAMTDVVEGRRGTARRIRTDRYRIAGKTGTAQVFTVKQDEEYDEEKISRKLRDHALFVAFAPVEDPQIAVAVIVENGGHGGAVAAPIARRVMDRYLLGKSDAKVAGTPSKD
jgi:penicillin-binding protein 2